MPIPDRRVGGFAAPLAVIMLIAVALLAMLLIEGALGEVRTGAAAMAESRVSAGAESALANALVQRLDTSVFSLPPGSVASAARQVGADSTETLVQLLGGSLARVVVGVSSRGRAIRVFAGRVALVRLRADTAGSAEVFLVPLGANWWVSAP